MLFAVRFVDNPGNFHLRAANMEAHLNWLRRHQSKVLAAGSLRSELDSPPVGGLWIVKAAHKAEVEALLQSDPFWIVGLRDGVEILSWHRAFPEPVLI